MSNWLKLGFLLLVLLFSNCKDSENIVSEIPGPEPEEEPIDGQEDYVERKFYGALLEPEKTVLHGAGQDDASYRRYSNILGSDFRPEIYMTYIGLTNPVGVVRKWGTDLQNQLKALPKGTIPQIGLSFVGGNDTGSGLDQDVADGKYDDQISELVFALKNLEVPAFVRIGYEFEGSWNGYSPEPFKKVFIKITKELRENETGAVTVWCSGGGSAGFVSHTRLLEFYPGDEWVDWWGVDIFSPEEITDARLKSFYKLADEHHKPVMIGETTPRYVGVKDGKESWEKWFAPFFTHIYENPEVKAFCYINWDWEYWSNELGFPWHDWKDARIQSSVYVRKAYKIEMKNPVFQHLNK